MQVQVVGDGLMVMPDKHQHGWTIEQLCEVGLKLPSNFVRQLIGTGNVHVQRTVAAHGAAVHAGQRIVLLGGVEEPFGVDLDGIPNTTTPWLLDIPFEDDHVCIVNKPAGFIVYPSSPSDGVTLAHLLALHYLQSGQLHKIRHVHRLDRDTTGAILYAKHAYSARAMDALLTEGKIKRTYVALVQGKLPHKTGTIDAPIGRDRHTNGRYRISRTGKPAVTDYRVLADASIANGHVSLVECQLRTGRTHQIRVHLASLGNPIMGDTLYGSGHGVGDIRYPSGYALHARKLAFRHPYLDENVEVIASLPADFLSAMEQLEMTAIDEG